MPNTIRPEGVYAAGSVKKGAPLAAVPVSAMTDSFAAEMEVSAKTWPVSAREAREGMIPDPPGQIPRRPASHGGPSSAFLATGPKDVRPTGVVDDRDRQLLAGMTEPPGKQHRAGKSDQDAGAIVLGSESSIPSIEGSATEMQVVAHADTVFRVSTGPDPVDPKGGGNGKHIPNNATHPGAFTNANKRLSDKVGHVPAGGESAVASPNDRPAAVARAQTTVTERPGDRVTKIRAESGVKNHSSDASRPERASDPHDGLSRRSVGLSGGATEKGGFAAVTNGNEGIARNPSSMPVSGVEDTNGRIPKVGPTPDPDIGGERMRAEPKDSGRTVTMGRTAADASSVLSKARHDGVKADAALLSGDSQSERARHVPPPAPQRTNTGGGTQATPPAIVPAATSMVSPGALSPEPASGAQHENAGAAAQAALAAGPADVSRDRSNQKRSGDARTDRPLQMGLPAFRRVGDEAKAMRHPPEPAGMARLQAGRRPMAGKTAVGATGEVMMRATRVADSGTASAQYERGLPAFSQDAKPTREGSPETEGRVSQSDRSAPSRPEVAESQLAKGGATQSGGALGGASAPPSDRMPSEAQPQLTTAPAGPEGARSVSPSAPSMPPLPPQTVLNQMAVPFTRRRTALSN